jgi:hypothetical protein
MTKHRIPRLSLLGLGLALALPALAQEKPQEPDEATKAAVEAQGFRLPPQLRQIAYRDANPWVLHTNVRMGSADSTITFGGIGNIAPNTPIPGADQTDVAERQYDDGRVVLDSPRDNEVDEDGNQTSQPGGRYQTNDDAGNLDGDYLSYTPGQTREWGFSNQEQYANGFISMNQFSTQAQNVSFSRDAESSGVGFEMSVSRRLLKIGRKMELGFSGSVGFSDISGLTSEQFTADLIRLTDTYQLLGDAPTAPYGAPVFGILSDPDIGIIIPGGEYELTVPLQQITPDRTVTTIPDGATVSGNWAIDGAYYSFRVGPELRGHLTEKIAFTVGAGLLGALVGTDFTAVEELQLEDYTLQQAVRFAATDSMTEVLVGYYAEITAEYWITQRTGFFLGAVIESLDDFVQTVGSRTATVAVGEALVFRVGIIHRF